MYKASICFLTTFKVTYHPPIFNHFQVDSIKRLIPLSFLLDNVYKNNITTLLNNNKKLCSIQPLEKYMEMLKTFNNVYIEILNIKRITSYRDIEKFVRDNNAFFKREKTLVNILILMLGLS